MQYDELDRILSDEPTILPSSGFTASVMAAVLRESSAMAPIAFPWMRVLPGLAACALVLAVLLQQFFAQPGIGAARFRSALIPDLVKAAETAKHFGVEWIAFSLLLTFLAMRFSARFAPREGPTAR